MTPLVGDAGMIAPAPDRSVRRFLVTIAMGGAGVAVGVVLLVALGRIVFTSGMADTGKVFDLQPLAQRSVVYARDGSVLQLLHAEENRDPVTLDKVPPYVVRAVLDAEDNRFYEHGAIDLRGLLRALVVNVESGGVYEGGSTITQQLVKVTFLNSRQDVNRKIKEAALAFRIEARMTKSEILERYLNTVYFGNGSYGLQAAAEGYFNTDVTHLTEGQGILLASLIRDPVGGDPFRHPVDARARRDVIVDRMVQLDHVPASVAPTLKAEPLPIPSPEPPAQASDYFTEHVKQLLLADTRLGSTLQERTFNLFKGGLRIHTTLDPNDQKLAEDAVANNLPDTGGKFNAAVVSVDPADGAVRALVGGPDFAQSKFNLATDGPGRQPGSSFKMFTLMAALEKGFSPNDTINASSPCSIPNPGGTPDPWTPANVEGEAGGVLSLTDATVHSINCAYARLVKIVGPDKVVDVAKRMGVTNPLVPHLSITLGSETVTPLQMADSYATLAADGVRHAPYFIDRVEDRDGNLLWKYTPKPVRAVSSDDARVETQVLSQVVQRGTGTAAAVPGWDVAGKTGTTDDHTNAWFVGYSRTLATAVWMGSPDGDVPMRNVGGISVFGGTYPAEIWHAYMAGALAGSLPVPFLSPDTYPAGSRYRSFVGDESPTGNGNTTDSTIPTTQLPAISIPEIPFPSIPQISIPSIPVFTVPPRTTPTISIPERPTRPPRGG